MNFEKLHKVFFGLVIAMMSFEAFAVRVRTAGRFADQFPPWVWILLGIANIGLSLLFFKSDEKFDAQVDKVSKSILSSDEPKESEIQKKKIKNTIWGVIFFSLGCWGIYMGVS